MASRAGSPNKNKEFLMKRLQDMYGEQFHPIMRMAENAVKLHDLAEKTGEGPDIKSALEGWDKIAAYTTPKLKSIEHSGEMTLGAYELSDTERAARITSILDQGRERRDNEVSD